MSVDAISIVIPNYNGEALLRDNLPSIHTALLKWGGSWQCIIVDDCSTDNSIALLNEHFPWVEVIKNPVNMGFSKTCNVGMAAVIHQVALCINSDVNVEENFIAPILRPFSDSTVFAVTSNILAEREGRNQGIVRALYGKGFLKGSFATLDVRGDLLENLYCIGACVAYDMDKFRALGGYAEIYTPYLFEDVDISYRAWKRGWKSVYSPGSTVYHYSSATLGKTKKRHKRTIYFRNRFIFHWINLSDPIFIFRNVSIILFRLCVSFLWLDFVYYKAFFDALKRLPDVVKLRNSEAQYRQLSDAAILSRTSNGDGNA